jgi:glycosyltransferase involved in cell wall biosynthesis
MSIVYVSDFDLRGSGYANIAISLCTQMAGRGFDVIALGLGYEGQEHHHPFRIVPAQLRELGSMVRHLQTAGVALDAVVVALDIPLQEILLDQLGAPGDLPYVGLFPLEADPLCSSWAVSLLRIDERLIMSRFGQAELAAVGVEATYIPIGVDTASWRPPTTEERAQIRQGLGIEDGAFVILTVADNQERKNLSRSLEIFAAFAREQTALYLVVTRPKSAVGWKLDDYAMELDIYDRLMLWERGIPFKSLWSLFAAADCFLLTSKAEGLAMPVLEAMACRLPVVGTDCTAIAEHLADGRGLLIESDYVMRDPWGNSRRYLAGLESGVAALRCLAGMDDGKRQTMLDRAEAYTFERTWEQTADVLIAAISRAHLSRSRTDGSALTGVLDVEMQSENADVKVAA